MCFQQDTFVSIRCQDNRILHFKKLFALNFFAFYELNILCLGACLNPLPLRFNDSFVLLLNRFCLLHLCYCCKCYVVATWKTWITSRAVEPELKFQTLAPAPGIWSFWLRLQNDFVH